MTEIEEDIFTELKTVHVTHHFEERRERTRAWYCGKLPSSLASHVTILLYLPLNKLKMSNQATYICMRGVQMFDVTEMDLY